MALRVAVTGASGFVGSALCHRLAADGHAVAAVTRAATAPPGASLCRIDGLDDAQGLQAAFAGADAVVHLAARVHVMQETAADPLGEFQRVNVRGTRTVLEAARAAGATRFIFMSSIKVSGEGRDAPYTEGDEPRPVDPYGQSKLDAERIVRNAGGALGWTIFRPPLVYGPGVRGNFRRMLWLAGISARWPLPLGGIDNLRSMIFVDNLADAMIKALVNPSARERTFLVSDDHDVSVSELVRRLAIGLGGRPHLFRAPVSLIQHLGHLLGRDADLARIFGTLRINCDLIQSALGWRPPVALSDALGVTARWWHGKTRG